MLHVLVYLNKIKITTELFQKKTKVICVSIINR